MPSLRVLLLADSHLGFDLPLRPRVDRRRRGDDFLANYRRALSRAETGNVDLVIHCGDVFHRPRVHPSLAFLALHPLLEIAEAGVPVFVVPGNHERARIPHHRFARHPNLHIFHTPGTTVTEAGGIPVAVAGFPYFRRGIRARFPRVLEETGWQDHRCGIRILCFHHCVEGATVGPSDHTFRHAPDVIRCSDLPAPFAAALSGHIHRHQVLRQDLRGRPLPTPVLYPGSLERTAFAEMGEEKGFMLLEMEPGEDGGRLVRHAFIRLPDRPMVVRDLHPRSGPEGTWTPATLHSSLARALESVPRDAVLRLRIHGRVPGEIQCMVGAPALRGLAPREMNPEVVLVEAKGQRRVRRGRPPAPGTGARFGTGDLPGTGTGGPLGAGDSPQTRPPFDAIAHPATPPRPSSDPGAGSKAQLTLALPGVP